MEIETLVEDKIVTTESIVGGETGVCEVDTSQEPYEGMVFESENGKDFLHVLYHPVSLSMMEQLYLADLLVIKKGLISAAKRQGKLKLEKEKANGRVVWQ